MRVLCSMPGKFGDILWALPTCRALAEVAGEPVDFLTSYDYRALCPLLSQQPYIREATWMKDWRVLDTAPMTPRCPPTDMLGFSNGSAHDRVIHLGYLEWPTTTLPYYMWQTTLMQWGKDLPYPDLETPWITVVDPFEAWDVTAGFTDEWFELKYGIVNLLTPQVDLAYACGSPRWASEGRVHNLPWHTAATQIVHGRIFFGDCSALHVLACALGKRCVIMEPAEARWNSIFYPYGTTGRVRLVTGNDGKPTFDSRHCVDAIKEALQCAS